MKFEYQAIDEDGGIIRGIIEAQTPQRVLQILLHKQLHPIDIRNLTDTTVEISRLHQLKQKLTGKTDIITLICYDATGAGLYYGTSTLNFTT